MVWRDLEIGKQLNVAQVACSQLQVQIFLMVDQQNLAIETEPGESLCKRFRLVVFEIERLDDVELILFQLQCQRGFQSGPEHLARQRS